MGRCKLIVLFYLSNTFVHPYSCEMPKTRGGKETWVAGQKCAVRGCDGTAEPKWVVTEESTFVEEPMPYCVLHMCQVEGCMRLAFRNAGAACDCDHGLQKSSYWATASEGWHLKCATHGKYTCADAPAH